MTSILTILLGCSFVSSWAEVVDCWTLKREILMAASSLPYPAVWCVVTGLLHAPVQTAVSAESNTSHHLSLVHIYATEVEQQR